MYAQQRTLALKLAAADAGNGLGIVAGLARLDAARCITVFTVGARDHDGPQTLGGVPGQNSASARRLVIGMSMHRHERRYVGHRLALFSSRGFEELERKFL